MPAQATSEALLQVALQAGASLGGELDACRGASRALNGRLTLEAALNQLLAGQPCRFRLDSRGAILIVAAPPGRPQPHTPPPLAPRPPVAAAAAPAPTTVAVGELVVTAGRRAELPGRTPYAISALRGSDLPRLGVTDIPALASLVAGMTVTNLGPGRDKVLLRGLSDGAYTGVTQSTVSLYLDDVPVTYNAPDPDLRLIDVDRVEVMRGPQGTLYGGGTMGGIVRVVTNRPDLDTYSGEATAGLSYTLSGGINTSLEAVANMPVLPGRVALRAAAYQEHWSGFIDDVNLGLKHVNSGGRDGARLAVRAQVTDDWSVTLGGIHQSINTDDTQYVLAGLGRLQRANSVREPHDNDFDEVSATVEGGGRWGRVVFSLARLLHHYDSRYDATPAVGAFTDQPGAAAFDDSRRVDLLVSELTLSSSPDERWRWLAGAFASSGRVDAQSTLDQLSPAPAQLYAETRVDHIREVAVYGETAYDLTSRLNAVVGLRWFSFAFSTDSLVTQGPGSRTFSDSGEANGFSPKFSLRYQPNGRTTYYVQAAEGYRPAGFNTAGPVGETFDGSSGGLRRQFDADELWNYEVGAKLQLMDGRVQLRLAAFYAVWGAIQSDQYLPSGLPYAVNVGDGANRGLEAEIDWRLSPAWRLRAAALVDDPQLTRVNPNFQSKPDAGLPGVTSGSVSAALSYRRPLTGSLEFRADAEAAYLGHSNVAFAPQSSSQSGGYATARISVALEAPHWAVSAFVDNPANSSANTFAFGNPFRIGRQKVITPLRPLTAGVNLTMRF
ncbi:TonB-dependent receptor [Phenylobacterium hankyongense]|uniref:TonB-dependent receptor n=1 Tax=Phenylobacterium hankyongense TaxID=1813876 RepID=UPI0014038F51|nr:TonB-dependent receptor [Phenylobacterium hankyongense]